MRNILITGASGFIGSYLTTYLTQLDVHYKIFDEDIKNYNELINISKVDCIIHLAGKAHNKMSDANELIEVNFNATVRFAEKAKELGIKRFVFLSSASVYGNTRSGLVTEEYSFPKSLFGNLKLETENALKQLIDNNFEVTILRPPLVCAIDAPANFKFLLGLVKKLPILPFGCVNNSRSVISIENLVNVIYLSTVHTKAANEIFNVADYNPISTKELTNYMSNDLLHVNRRQFYVPVFLLDWCLKLLGKGVASDLLFRDLHLDTSKVRDLLDWEPKPFMTIKRKYIK